ncbi:hypothetical protein SLEP1_g27975 [Rubroshorea leprosula]|uniref:FHA domain-containing protein n=1 Tax=Rubroshorea leprosula TaxID=152421 RepID=A0AAV5JXN5_9ROSI|nr:hypothetical protein SLEP1_g27975 [Rubroshorea leprosula]
MVIREKSKIVLKSAIVELRCFDLPLVSPSTGSPLTSLRLEPDRPYTIGRTHQSCDFLFDNRFVSKQHCQILFDGVGRKILISDGAILLRGVSSVVDEFRKRICENELEEKKGEGVGCCRFRVSLNGVYVNGVRLRKGMVKELLTGDDVSLVCGNESVCNFEVRVGFLIQGIVFEEVVSGANEVAGEMLDVLGMVSSQGTVSSGKRSKRVFANPANVITSHYGFSKLKCGDVIRRANFLLSLCRHILHSDDPICCIRQCNISNVGMKGMHTYNSILRGLTLSGRVGIPVSKEEEVTSLFPAYRQESQSCHKRGQAVHSTPVTLKRRKVAALEAENNLLDDSVPSNHADERGNHGVIGGNAVVSDEPGMPLLNFVAQKDALDIDSGGKGNISTNFHSPPGKKFYLNRLEFMDHDSFSCQHTVSLPELLHPVQSISQIFIATFTSDILWFLSCCQIPSNLPVTVACHNAERCWSSSPESRASMPFPNFPNLVLVFPPFPEAIAFGNDRKRQGIACHHPKLLILQREDSIRVVITSANLVPKQWDTVTNTVWWQDFPRRNEPDYLSLFPLPDQGINHDLGSDFAAQLAGFVASLIVDIPSQAHWIVELTKYDFSGALGHLVASVPGIYSFRTPQSMHFMPAKHFCPLLYCEKFLGLVEASVVGLSHLFRTAADSNGAQLKKLASYLGKSHENAYGMLDIVLRRASNIPADENAVSVLVPNPDELSGGVDCIQLGFLPRNVAKWVSPLWDIGLFVFHGFLYCDEALAAAFGGNNMKVQLILLVSQGPCFSDISKLIQPELFVALCSLIASVQRCVGLWRLEEVLGRYKWPESQESDFIYGASSIGSVNAQFLAAFAAASGKRSLQLYDSEESDPDWGCWTCSQELRNPSIRILYPTIDRVKNACNGIHPSRQILCFSEKTWQKLRTVDIFHDAIPYPHHRVGHPMHVKVARRRFWSKTEASSVGWVYCGSHNFSAAAWGRPISSSTGIRTGANSPLVTRLHVSNYELGIIFVFPPAENKGIRNDNSTNLDDIVLPFVVPAPKYGPEDRPATPQSMREVLRELSERDRDSLMEVETTEEMMAEIPCEDEVIEATNFVAEEKEEDKSYAELLWIQVDSSQSC